MGRVIKTIIVLVAFIGFIGVVAFGALLIVSGGDVFGFAQTTLIQLSLSSRQEELNTAIGTDDTPTRFTVNVGDTPPVIASNLQSAQFISDADLFVDYVRVENLDTELEAGVYFLNQTQTIPEIAQLLTDSRNASITFRVLEGSRIEEIALSIDAYGLFGFTSADFLQVISTTQSVDPIYLQNMGIPVGATLEGFLFPDTYSLPPDITAEGLRDILLNAFESNLAPQWLSDAQAQGLSMRDVVTLASIVEREAVWDDEKALIASVYRNRLDIGMKLDADPTVQYAINGTRGDWWTQITQADYQAVISPYNTYLNTGLPPGPIASPGLAAIESVIYPETNDFLYFRARCDGSSYHNFAETFEGHLANGCTS